MYTYQDFVSDGGGLDAIRRAVDDYRAGDLWREACLADEYEAQRNPTIVNYTKYLYTSTGRRVPDTISANSKIASNIFHRLNTQRCSYLLGNGISFSGETDIKSRLGADFDRKIYDAGYYALIHGVSYLLWNLDHVEVFPATQVCPLWDEYTGTLRACIRFWSLDWQTRPVTVEVYEENGYTVYRTKNGGAGLDLEVFRPKRAYIQQLRISTADGEEIVGQSNYTTLPVIPVWGSKRRRSTIAGMQAGIDAYDLIKSGFANDLQDCAQIYWLITGNFGMEADETQRFMERLKLQHVANVDGENSSITPYTQEIPTAARDVFLQMIRKSLYDDFGALDVSGISASAKTATEIESAYQPMDEEADDFEYQVSAAILQLLALLGIEGAPTYKRNKITNMMEQTQMIMMAAQYLDSQTVVSKLPFVSVDEVADIMEAKYAEDSAKFALSNEEAEGELNV